MDSINFNWLENDKTIIDTLVASSTAPANDFNASNDILQYLLQTDESDIAAPVPNSLNNNTVQPPVEPSEKSHVPEKPMCSSSAATEFRSTVSVVQSKDNFVTFMPLNVPTKKPTVSKKTKFKEPIFVTESPQNAYKKKKKSNNSNNTSQLSHSSGEDNSDDDMMLDDELAASSNPSKLKQMTSKERRQLRNKISARNFRVRRKEYITQLEEKVEEHEKTITGLKQENSKLRSANEELMKQLLNQPITPPSSSSDELHSSASTSGSEGHHSPETAPPMFQFQLNDLYDFNLFDQQQQLRQQDVMDVNNLFYLNHAVMPDWDIHQVLGEKGRPLTSDEDQRQVSRDLISDYPLLAPALMSIVLRHTLSLEYVTSLAKEFSESIGADLTGKTDSELPAYSDEGYKAKNTLKIEPSTATEVEEEEEDEEMSEQRVAEKMLNDFFPSYVFYRARGYSHEEIIQKCYQCFNDKNSKCNIKKAKKEAKKKAKSENSSKQSTKLSTLQTYCRVAGTLLKHPQRMAHVNKVLKAEISFTQNKHTARIESNYASLINPFKNLRIASSSNSS